MPKIAWTSLKEAGGIITTVVLAFMVGGWLVAVASQLGNPVSYDSAGRVSVDTFTRSKDVLVLLLPFLTTAVGFWLGSQGTGQMERQAERAVAERDQAHAETQLVRGETRAALQRAADSEQATVAERGATFLWRERAETQTQRAESAEIRADQLQSELNILLRRLPPG